MHQRHQTTDAQIADLRALGGVHVNVSFDGFRPDSHGRFRGSTSSFAVTKATTEKFAAAGLLQGLLSTPNALTNPAEFARLCEFAVGVGAQYVLMNPLSSFGRGVKSKSRLAADEAQMRAIQAVTTRFAERGLELVHIRFPNDDKPLGGCDLPGRSGLELLQVDPRTLVIGANVRTDAALDKAFVGSIKDRGVREPIIVRRDGEGRLVVRKGQRRTLGAIQAGRELVTVVVESESAADDDAARQVDRLIDQLGENQHRTGITVGDEARPRHDHSLS